MISKSPLLNDLSKSGVVVNPLTKHIFFPFKLFRFVNLKVSDGLMRMEAYNYFDFEREKCDQNDIKIGFCKIFRNSFFSNQRGKCIRHRDTRHWLSNH